MNKFSFSTKTTLNHRHHLHRRAHHTSPCTKKIREMLKTCLLSHLDSLELHNNKQDRPDSTLTLLDSPFITIDYWLMFSSHFSFTFDARRDEVLSKNKYLEDEARRKAESVEREKNELNLARKVASSSSIASNIGETQEAQDDDIFYDSDAEKQPEEWVSSLLSWLISNITPRSISWYVMCIYMLSFPI